MSTAEKAAALLEAVGSVDLQRMAPARRRRFAELCRHTTHLAETIDQAAKAGVLARLQDGERAP